MTDCNKPVSRVMHAAQVREAGHYRSVVVIVEPNGTIGFRAKGCRATYYLPVTTCYAMACKAHALKVIAEKKAAKKARRHG